MSCVHSHVEVVMARIICMQDKFLHLVSVCIKENILLKTKKTDEAIWREEGGFPHMNPRLLKTAPV